VALLLAGIYEAYAGRFHILVTLGIAVVSYSLNPWLRGKNEGVPFESVRHTPRTIVQEYFWAILVTFVLIYGFAFLYRLRSP